MKGKTPPDAASSPEAKAAPQKAKNRNPGKQQRQLKRQREREKLGRVEISPMAPSKKKNFVLCSNPRFHPHHCDCPVHEDVLAFIDAAELKKLLPEKPAVTAYVFHDEISKFVEPRKKPEPEYSTETPKLPELVVGLVSNEKIESLTQRFRDAICEIGELRAKNRGHLKAIESLENQLTEARNHRKGKTERRKKVRNKRASEKAFEHGVMGVGRSDRTRFGSRSSDE